MHKLVKLVLSIVIILSLNFIIRRKVQEGIQAYHDTVLVPLLS